MGRKYDEKRDNNTKNKDVIIIWQRKTIPNW